MNKEEVGPFNGRDEPDAANHGRIFGGGPKADPRGMPRRGPEAERAAVEKERQHPAQAVDNGCDNVATTGAPPKPRPYSWSWDENGYRISGPGLPSGGTFGMSFDSQLVASQVRDALNVTFALGRQSICAEIADLTNERSRAEHKLAQLVHFC